MNAFREWLNTLFGSDGGRAIQMLFALLLVVLLILAVTWLFRRLFGSIVQRGRSPRLSVVDSTLVDHHRRLILVRRDEVEHLVMIGGPNDVLVESRILRAAPSMAGRPIAPARAPAIAPAPQTALPQSAPAQAALPQAAPAPAALAQAAPTQVVAPTPMPVAPARPAEPPIPEPRSEPPAPTPQPAPARAQAAPAEAPSMPPPPPLGTPTISPAARVAGGAAAVVAAVASAGALLRSRISRADEPVDVPFHRPNASEPDRRTLDDAFDSPLGRPTAPRPAAPIEAPRPMPTTVETPTAAEDRAEIADRLERALDGLSTAPTPTARNLGDIDLLADFDLVAAELSRPATPRPTPAPEASEEPDLPFAEPLAPHAAPEVEPVVIDEPSAPVHVEPHFDFDFDFGLSPGRAAPAPEPVEAAEVDHGIEIIRTEPPEPAEPPTAAPEITPPTPRAPTSVDELEEEMARLLSELSGQPRR